MNGAMRSINRGTPRLRYFSLNLCISDWRASRDRVSVAKLYPFDPSSSLACFSASCHICLEDLSSCGFLAVILPVLSSKIAKFYATIIRVTTKDYEVAFVTYQGQIACDNRAEPQLKNTRVEYGTQVGHLFSVSNKGVSCCRRLLKKKRAVGHIAGRSAALYGANARMMFSEQPLQGWGCPILASSTNQFSPQQL